MLNEAPKKKKKNIDYAEPTRWQLFWRIQREGWRRMVSPFFMYLFMSSLALALEAIVPDKSSVLEIILGSICIAGGAAFNTHLLFNTGKLHYDSYLTGCIHRRNRALGIMSGGDHHVEREYRVWKGFFIGLLIGIPAIILGVIAGAVPTLEGPAYFFMAMFTGWAIFPPRWAAVTLNRTVSGYWSLLMVLMPVLVSGIAYIAGAYFEKGKKAKEAERREEVQSAGTAAAEKKGKKHK